MDYEIINIDTVSAKDRRDVIMTISDDEDNTPVRGCEKSGKKPSPDKVPGNNLCWFCKGQHKLAKCPTAPTCTQCSRKGHTTDACRTAKICDTCGKKHSGKCRLKKEQKAKNDRRAKAQVKAQCDSLEGRTTSEVLPTLITQENIPNTGSKVTIEGQENFFNGLDEVAIDIADDAVPNQAQEQLEEEPILNDVQQFYWDTKIEITRMPFMWGLAHLTLFLFFYFLPQYESVYHVILLIAMLLEIKFRKFWVAMTSILSIAIGLSLHLVIFLVLPEYDFSLLLFFLKLVWYLIGLYFDMKRRVTYRVIKKLTAQVDDNYEDVDHRTDVERLNKLKHPNQLRVQCKIEYVFSLFEKENAIHFSPEKNLNSLIKENSLAPLPPPFACSLENALQISGPSIMDVKSTLEEKLERVNYAIRASGSVSGSRYDIFNEHVHSNSDAGILAMYIAADRHWRMENALGF
jgi:hypothetical protein